MELEEKISTTTAPAQLNIETSHRSPATARVTVAGEVDLATTPILSERLLRVLRDQRPDLLDVDLAEVTFVDCTRIGALVAVRNAALRAGCQMQISHPQPIVRCVLEVTGLLSMVTGPGSRAGTARDTGTSPGLDPPGGHNDRWLSDREIVQWR